VCSSLAAIAMKLKAQGKSPQVYQRFGTAQRLKVSAAEAFLKVTKEPLKRREKMYL
jgi:hypothetical protein